MERKNLALLCAGVLCFWLFALAWFIVGLFVSGLAIQYMAYFVSLGFSTTMRANIGSVMAAFTIVATSAAGPYLIKSVK